MTRYVAQNDLHYMTLYRKLASLVHSSRNIQLQKSLQRQHSCVFSTSRQSLTQAFVYGQQHHLPNSFTIFCYATFNTRSLINKTLKKDHLYLQKSQT